MVKLVARLGAKTVEDQAVHREDAFLVFKVQVD